MQVGDIYWADLPRSNGHEQHGLRPVMVLQDDRYAGSLPTVLVVPMTGTLAAGRFAATVVVPATPTNGLKYDSVLLVFQLRVLDRARFRGQIGAVEPAVLADIYAALDRLTAHP